MAISLLSKKPRETREEINKVVLLPIDKICANRSQPRKYFDPDALEELGQSIQSNGLLQPITVRAHPDGGYELIAGERRLLAFQQLGKREIPAIVEQFTDDESAVLALIENLQRRDLNFFEEAAAIYSLMQQLGLTQVQMSQKLGKAQSTIANKLRLLKYTTDNQDRMLEAGLTERHARALLKLPDINDEAVINHIIHERLNVEQTERYVQSILNDSAKGKATRLFVIKDMRIFLNSINRAVKMMQEAGVPVNAQKAETDEMVTVTLHIPKAAVYRKRPERPPVQQRMESV